MVICFWFFLPAWKRNQRRVALLFWWNAQWGQRQVVEGGRRVWAGGWFEVACRACGKGAEAHRLWWISSWMVYWAIWDAWGENYSNFKSLTHFPADSTKNMTCRLLLSCLFLWMKMAEMLRMDSYPFCEFLWIKLIYLLKIYLFFPSLWATYTMEQIHNICQSD